MRLKRNMIFQIFKSGFFYMVYIGKNKFWNYIVNNFDDLVVLLIVLIMLFITFTKLANAQIVDSITLDKDYNSILDYKEVEMCTQTSPDGCKASLPVIQYIYYSDIPVKDDPNEIVSARTANTKFYNDNRYKIYAGTPFYKINGNWYETDIKQTDLATWEQVTTDKNIDNIISKLNPLKIYKAVAQSYYSDSDCSTYKDDLNNWTNTRDSATSHGHVHPASNQYGCQGEKAASLYIISRDWLSFDTSGLDDAKVVDTAELHLFTDNQGDSSNSDSGVITVFNTTPDCDDNDYGETKADTQGSDKISLADMNQNDHENTFTLNTDGEESISLTGTTYFGIQSVNDNENIEPSARGYCWFYTEQQTGTALDPYLEIVMTDPPEEPPGEETATTSPASCYPDNINDLGFISSCSFTVASTSITYTNYHIPFFVWIVIAIISLFIADRIILEFIIRWRR